MDLNKTFFYMLQLHEQHFYLLIYNLSKTTAEAEAAAVRYY